MRAFVVHEPERESLRLYLEIAELENGSRLFKTYNGGFQEVPMGSEPPMYLRLPEPFVRPIADAIAPRPEFGERHLNDAIEVRDRLLKMIEVGNGVTS